jgi:ribonuclease P protein component
MTSSVLFSSATRHGRRVGTRTVVLHLHDEPESAGAAVGECEPQVGFVVSKAVGNAVTRNRVKRRLRHLASERLARLPRAAALVVRALPAAADAPYAQLGADFDTALRRLERRSSGSRVSTP